ncbi:MAG: hypothetical protein GY860_22160, partial [Desulfobacteraceae bacterium]|nr:hypothetical protein [Desulfobacteraceae bacterium]
MTSITGTPYNANNLYYYPSEESTNLSRKGGDATSENEAESPTGTGDTVTLSPDVARA